MKTMLKREPATVMAVIQAILALALSFGLDLSTQQIGAIMAVAAAVLGLVTRSQTYSRYEVMHDPAMSPIPGTRPGPTPQGDSGTTGVVSDVAPGSAEDQRA